jgi:hypothetical protein
MIAKFPPVLKPLINTLTFVGSIKSSVQRPGIEPGTSAVLKPRHNQLDHLCARDVIYKIQKHSDGKRDPVVGVQRLSVHFE